MFNDMDSNKVHSNKSVQSISKIIGCSIRLGTFVLTFLFEKKEMENTRIKFRFGIIDLCKQFSGFIFSIVPVPLMSLDVSVAHVSFCAKPLFAVDSVCVFPSESR